MFIPRNRCLGECSILAVCADAWWFFLALLLLKLPLRSWRSLLGTVNHALSISTDKVATVSSTTTVDRPTSPSLHGGSKGAPTVFISLPLAFLFLSFVLSFFFQPFVLIETMHCFHNYSAARVDDCSGGSPSLSFSVFDFVFSAAKSQKPFFPPVLVFVFFCVSTLFWMWNCKWECNDLRLPSWIINGDLKKIMKKDESKFRSEETSK